MKNILITLLVISSGIVLANPMWTQYEIKVDNPESGANIIAATDEFMASNFAKENFKGSLHLNSYIANGESDATHFFAVLQPSLDAHMQWINTSSQSEAGQKFFSVLRANSTPVSEQFNSFIQTYGTPSNEDVVWIIHEFFTQPSNVEEVLKHTSVLDKEIKGNFPGQFGISAVSFGGGAEVSHLLTVGYSSISELESWEDQVATNKALQKYFNKTDKIIDWKGSKLLFNARIYDSASDLEQFVTKDFED
mgnify:CR=1 FL=1|tara:strand:- start:842 stop:1591 length:750 start_codon:yes stop_codon:yes gene_type:complete